MSLLSDVRELIDDVGVLFTDAHVYDAINEASVFVCAETSFVTSTATHTVTGNQEYLTRDVSVMIPQAIRGSARDKYIATTIDMNRYLEGWRSTTQTEPTHFLDWNDSETLQIWPIANQDYAYIEEGIGYPTEVTSTSTDYTTIPPVKEAVKFLAASILVSMLRPDLKDGFVKEAQEALLRVKERARKNRMVALRPNSPQTLAHAGNISKGKGPQRYW